MSKEEMPWWYYKCVHNDPAHMLYIDEGRQYGCWKVLHEAEGAAVLHQRCMNKVHILVDLASKVHICQTMKFEDYEKMSPRDLLQFVQSQRTYLKTL